MCTLSAVVFAGTAALHSLHAAPKEKPRLAVLPLTAQEGVSPALAGFATDLVSTAMVNTRLFIVVDRQSIGKVLEEQAFQKSGCTDTSCAVNLGRLLAAEKIMVGTMIKIGPRIIINAQIIDVEKGKVDFAASRTIPGVDALQNEIEELARAMAAKVMGVDENALRPRDDRAWPNVWRSALVPGWGQLRKDDPVWAGIFAGGVLGGLAFAAIHSVQLEKAQAEYRDFTTPLVMTWGLGLQDSSLPLPVALLYFQPLRARLGQQESQTGAGLQIAGLFWLINVLHAGVAEHAKSSDSATESGRVYFAVAPVTDISMGYSMDWQLSWTRTLNWGEK